MLVTIQVANVIPSFDLLTNFLMISKSLTAELISGWYSLHLHVTRSKLDHEAFEAF